MKWRSKKGSRSKSGPNACEYENPSGRRLPLNWRTVLLNDFVVETRPDYFEPKRKCITSAVWHFKTQAIIVPVDYEFEWEHAV